MTATKTARRSNPEEVRIEVVPHAGGVTICAVCPDVEGQQPNRCEPGPSGQGTKLSTVNRAITLHLPTAFGAELRASTLNGSIRLLKNE